MRDPQVRGAGRGFVELRALRSSGIFVDFLFVGSLFFDSPLSIPLCRTVSAPVRQKGDRQRLATKSSDEEVSTKTGEEAQPRPMATALVSPRLSGCPKASDCKPSPEMFTVGIGKAQIKI